MGLFSRSRLQGTRGPACTRRKFGARAGSVARALGVQTPEIWQVITGSLAADLRRAEHDNRKPTCQLLCSAAVKALYLMEAKVYNSSRTSSLCGPLLYVCGHCVRVCRCVRVCVFVCWNPTFQPKFFLLCLLPLLLPNHAVCITPSLKLSSSRPCGRHGTTAVAQQVCVEHYLYLLCVCYHSKCVRAVCAMIRICMCA